MVRMREERRSRRASRTTLAAAAVAAFVVCASCDPVALKLEAIRLVEEAGGGGGPWSVETVASAGDVGKWASIGIYQNEPRIAYHKSGDYDVMYVKRSGTIWGSPELVYNSLSFGTYISLAIDSATDRPSISHVGGAGDTVYNTSYYSSAWHNDWMVSGAGTLSDTAIYPGVASPIIAYIGKEAAIREARFVSIQGSPETIYGTNIAFCIDIFRDSSDGVHVVFGRTDGLSYRKKSGGSWGAVTTISSGPYVTDCSIAVGFGATYHATAFIDGNLHALYYAQSSDGATWTVNQLTQDVGGQCSIALGTAGAPCIAYYDSAQSALKFAFMDSDLVWHFETVDGADATDVGSYCSIAVDGNIRIHIAYYDATNGDLKYATRSSPW